MAAGSIPAGASTAPAHSPAFRTRRFLNWFPLGISYALLYMARYNLNVGKSALGALMTKEDFGIIFGVGTVVYGFAFLFNGPLTDKIGGKRAMLISVLGAAAMNLLMGAYILEPSQRTNADLRFWFSVLYAGNMYFQSFGAVAIVKVNAHWFHVRERGGFSGIFGTMISSGIFLAYTVNGWLLSFAAQLTGKTELSQAKVIFFIPGLLLAVLFVVELFLLKDRPSEAGHEDFDTGDASSGEGGDVPVLQLMKRILTHPIIFTIALIEFCTGILRQGVMQWYPFFSESVLSLPPSHPMRNGSTAAFGPFMLGCAVAAAVFFTLAYRSSGKRKAWLAGSGMLLVLAPFLQGGWGGLLFVAGVIGGNVAGYVSDWFFNSRRAPAAGGLYAVLLVCTLLMAFTMGHTQPIVAQADSKLPQLQVGDRVLSVAGQDNLKDWPAVRQAFQRIPPRSCLLGARWDSDKKLCSMKPTEEAETMAASSGLIPVVIERAGVSVTLELKDWALDQRAGEPRVIKATPVQGPAPWILGAVVFVMSLCVIGTHGLLSGTATMDFGGRKGAATAVGMIDGFVYLGTAVQSFSLGYLTARDWDYWPWFMLPFALMGFLLCLRIWNAKPQAKGQSPAISAVSSGEASGAATARTGT
jgi:MFS transporter, OPA family, glycerol-3-phosphate transporter